MTPGGMTPYPRMNPEARQSDALMRPVESFETGQSEMKGSTCQLILNQDQGMFQRGSHAAYERVRYSSGISSDHYGKDLS